MLSDKLDGLQQALRLVHIAPDAHVVDRDLLDRALGVDNEKPSQRDPCILLQHPIPRRDILQTKHNDVFWWYVSYTHPKGSCFPVLELRLDTAIASYRGLVWILDLKVDSRRESTLGPELAKSCTVT